MAVSGSYTAKYRLELSQKLSRDIMRVFTSLDTSELMDAAVKLKVRFCTLALTHSLVAGRLAL